MQRLNIHALKDPGPILPKSLLQKERWDSMFSSMSSTVTTSFWGKGSEVSVYIKGMVTVFDAGLGAH